VRPTRVEHLVDDTERLLDALDIDRAHLAGNSLGGWMALELSQRGRALSVCAFSPAGAWGEGDASVARRALRATVQQARMFRWLVPWLALSPALRAWMLRLNARRARVSRDELLALIDDVLGCEVREEILSSDERLQPLANGCEVTLAWPRGDRLLPLKSHGQAARQLMPSAHFVVLEGVGHVPMFDDPQLVADTILAAIARARA
jgi:pimeloyl-ACP methyl ester carboxylesterase